MGKNILFSILIFLLLPLTSYPVAQSTDQLSAKVEEPIIDAKQLDKRAQILKEYLQRYDSALQYHAQDFVDAADANGIDWKLVPAISGVESTFGQVIPGGYNAWGWGVYGDQALGFNSWTEGIFTVSQGLKQNYINKGLTEPLAMNRIYAASPTWGSKVNYFLKDLDQFTKVYNDKNSRKISSLLHKTAGISAQLASEN